MAFAPDSITTNLMKNHFIEQIGMSIEGVDYLVTLLSTEHLDADDFFIREGHFCYKIGFLASGFTKNYYLEQGEEVINSFSEPGHWIGSLSSIEFQYPITYSVKAIIDCKLLTLTKNNLVEFRKSYEHDWEKMKLYSNLLTSKMKINKTQTIKQQYESFLQNHETLSLALRVEDIAAYLRIPHHELVKIICEMVSN